MISNYNATLSLQTLILKYISNLLFSTFVSRLENVRKSKEKNLVDEILPFLISFKEQLQTFLGPICTTFYNCN
jgi:hypothetical protein